MKFPNYTIVVLWWVLANNTTANYERAQAIKLKLKEGRTRE